MEVGSIGLDPGDDLAVLSGGGFKGDDADGAAVGSAEVLLSEMRVERGVGGAEGFLPGGDVATGGAGAGAEEEELGGDGGGSGVGPVGGAGEDDAGGVLAELNFAGGGEAGAGDPDGGVAGIGEEAHGAGGGFEHEADVGAGGAGGEGEEGEAEGEESCLGRGDIAKHGAPVGLSWSIRGSVSGALVPFVMKTASLAILWCASG